MRIAALRLDKAGIQLGKERFSATPEVGLSPADAIAGGKRDKQRSTTSRETESLGTGLTWKLDIWGKIRKDLPLFTLPRPWQYGHGSKTAPLMLSCGALAGHFHEAERRDGQDVGLGLVALQPVLHALVDRLLVAAALSCR